MSPKLDSKSAKVGTKRAFANLERDAQVKRLGRVGRAMVLLFATFLSFGTIALLAADQLYRPDAFVIDQLKIKGSFRYLDPQLIEDQVNGYPVGNFFSIRLSDIKQRIEALALVQSAEVRREWPNTLLIEVKEQRPVMRWHNERWVNSNGDVIELPTEIVLDQPIFLKGQVSDSKEMLGNANRWAKQLNNRGLTLLGVSLSESHSYTLNMTTGNDQSTFDLLLGREQVEQRLDRFVSLFEHQYRHGNERLERVDARYPNGLAIKASLLELEESFAFDSGMTDETQGFPKR